MIRKIKIKERKNGMKYCTFCKREGKKKIDAIWRDSYMNFSCEDHKSKLYEENEDFTEADYQTWMNL